MGVRLQWSAVLAFRLRRQHLAKRAAPEAWREVVGDIAGLHAQVWSSAELTLAARVDGLEPGLVTRATWEDRELVKIWAMRGTLHLLRADELPFYVGAQGALKPRWHQNAWLKAFGLTREEAETLMTAIPAALDGDPLTRAELADRAGGAHAEKLREGFGALLKPAAFTGALCFAPDEGRNVRFTRPDRWLTGFAPASTEDGVAFVARRYLAAYGPATREDFARWFGSPSPATAGKMLRSLGDEVVEVELEGTTRLALAADLDALRSAEPEGIVRLLPAFDQLVVSGPRNEPAVLDPARKAQVYRQAGWLSPVLCVDGRIEGVWSHEVKDGALRVAVEPFGRLSAPVRAGVAREAERLAAFLGADDVAVKTSRRPRGAARRA
jgi:Winged helix DNA-binding domain